MVKFNGRRELEYRKIPNTDNAPRNLKKAIIRKEIPVNVRNIETLLF